MSDLPPMQGVDRALRLISLLGTRGAGFTLDELSRASDIPKSSLHRLLAAMRARGYATQPEESSRYFLGPAALESAYTFHDSMDLRALVHPLVQRVRARFNETAHMGVLDGSEVVYLDKVEADHSLRLTSVIGGRNPAHATGVGMAMLARTLLTLADVDQWVERYGPLEPRTIRTATSAAELAQRLEVVRLKGYAVDDEESELGVRCVAVPVLFGGPGPIAAVSFTAPKDRLNRSAVDPAGRELREMAAALDPRSG